jgi:hypothetical protein
MTDPRQQFERMANQLPIGRDPASVRKRLEAMEMLLERSMVVPGTNYRVGLDAVVGLVPVVGDLITTAMGAWIVWEARNLGMSKFHLVRMGRQRRARPGRRCDTAGRRRLRLRVPLQHPQHPHPEALARQAPPGDSGDRGRGGGRGKRRPGDRLA